MYIFYNIYIQKFNKSNCHNIIGHIVVIIQFKYMPQYWFKDIWSYNMLCHVDREIRFDGVLKTISFHI